MKVRFAVAPAPGVFGAEALVSFAVSAEALGFDTIWLSDVPLGSIGDPLLSLAHVAALTTTLKLGANIVPLGRNPMILARQLAQLDRLSGGRLLLSLVPGIAQPGERAALGLPTGDRWRVIEHNIGLFRRWWAGETVDDHEGPFTFEGIAVRPTPLQEPLEIWLGGAGPKALARVGRSADGWLTANLTPSEAAAGRDLVERHAREAGRVIDPEHFGISMPYARELIPGQAVAALGARRADGDLAGIVPVGPSELVELIDAHIGAGLSKFVLRPLDPHHDVSAQLGWLAENVLPLQT